MNAKICLFLLFGSLICIHACECGKGKDIPDVSNVPIEVEFKRFEQSLFSIDTNDIANSLPALEQEYGEFAEIFFGQILGSKDPQNAPEGHANYVRGFVTHPGIRKLYDTTQVVFANTTALERDFEQAFKFFKYYFPEEPLSGEVVTFISEYTIGGFLYGENSIAVGLDFYLGESYPYAAYNPANPNFSAYLTRTFNKDHVVLKSMKLLVQDMLLNPGGNKLLDYMIQNGKELYVLDQLLPEAPDSVKLEFSQKQVDWCNENETNIWAYFLAENLLYSTEYNKFQKLVEYSPHSPGMPKEAPGRTANWLGWQIVKAYMDRNPETTLRELVDIKDAQTILNESRYKPRK
jgi:hypothetical protein